MGYGIPMRSDEQEGISGGDVKCAVHDAFGAPPSDRYANLLSASAITTVERWCLCDDRFVEHQNDRTRARPEAAFEAPFALRQCSSRSANVWRGRFQVTFNRFKAYCTLRRPAVI